LRARLRIAEESEVVLFVGRLAPEKELASLVRGFAKVAALRPQVMLVLVGDGPCREEVYRLAGALAEEGRIRFTGAMPSSAVHEWVQIADVFALVSSLEGLPVSLIEAMATGLPVVVSDIPANRQLVDTGVEGMVVETRNADAIGSALDSILSDGAARRRMGAAARSRIGERFSTVRVVGLYEALFERLLGRKASAMPPDGIGFPAGQ
jgi:glycosyltransferase involved in cell wall biosynthesis